jgi:hypothetical protein
MKRSAKILLSGLFILNIVGTAKSQINESNVQQNLSINLKSRAIVVGPVITLGDIGYIVLQDSVKRLLLTSIKIGDAPPPGESSEISLNYIKKCLKMAGFKDDISALRGPKVIRVTTAQIEIDKAFLKEEYAYSPREQKCLPICGTLEKV